MPTPLLPVDFEALFHHLPDSFLLLTPDGTVVTNSDRHVGVSLLPREQAVGRDIFDAFPSAPESQQALRESHDYVRQHRQPHTMPLTRYDLERPAALGGGTEERYWQITHYPLLNAAGELQYILQRPQDVTEKHLAERREAEIQRQLADSQQQARFVLEALPVLIWTCQADGSVSAFNQRWLHYTGRSSAESLGWGWMQDLDPAQREDVEQRWKTAAQRGAEFQLEFRLRRADGQYRWLLVRCVPRKADDGSVSQWVGGGTDIHEQKEMVQELLRANEQQADMAEMAYQAQRQALSQRETFYNLFQQAPALICILRGPDHVFDFVNPQYQELFRGRELVGKRVGEALPEVEEQGFISLLDNVYQTGETFYGKEILIMVDHGDAAGPQQLYLNFTYQLFSEGGHRAGITVFAYDVTDLVVARKRLEKQSADATPASR
ncbi:PAS domain-containing protein [Hymenobacter persicinus]|uniref:histidine kinase n=1 Tax=Hymenobacter persicinus TaxID=2025506 RepID=A0A4V1ZA73_9BACT|nr:PAS domain-containing protein [Hymenobacter persicinus]RYU74528.1 PAS domain S-box protein [Hymenobacter persicinus]